MADTVDNQPRPVLPYASPPVRRRPWRWWLAGLGVAGLVLLLFLLAVTVRRQEAVSEREAAQRRAVEVTKRNARDRSR